MGKDDKGNEILSFRRFPDLPGVELLTTEGCSRLLKFFHQTYTVCGVRRNTCEYAYRGQVQQGPPGELSAMEPGEVHVTRKVSGPGDFSVLFLDPAYFEKLARELGVRTAKPHLRRWQVRNRDLFQEFERLCSALTGPATVLERESRLVAHAQGLLDTCGEASPKERSSDPELEAVRRARNLLLERCADNITLEELAREAGLGRYHLVREFRRQVGVPPHRFQIMVRLARSRGLLAKGMRVVQVAAELGFTDQSHFHHHFLRHYNLTPGHFVRGLGRA